MNYRQPPAVLPSLRDHRAEVERLALGLDWADRMCLRIWSRERIADLFPEIADVVDDAVRADEALRRAARAPCPVPSERVSGGGDNAAMLALIREIRRLVRPPSPPRPGAGLRVLA